MRLSDFYYFGNKFFSTPLQAQGINLSKDENDIHDCWNLIKGNYNHIKFPVHFKQEYGKKFMDILGTGWPALYLISDRLKNVLEENQLTGWRTFPIKLYDKKGKEINGYHGFSITGRCAPLSYKNCEIIEKQYVPEGPIVKFYKGVSLSGWDGSDFFTPNGTYHIIISKKAQLVLKENKISNLEMSNLAEHETDVDNVKM